MQSDHTPALLQLLWDRYGVLPRNLIFVEIAHRKVPYIHDGRYVVTVFDKGRNGGSISSVELSFGFMEEPNVERALDGMARLKEIESTDGCAAVDRARVARESVAGAVDGTDPATSLPSVHAVAPPLPARLLLLWAGR